MLVGMKDTRQGEPCAFQPCASVCISAVHVVLCTLCLCFAALASCIQACERPKAWFTQMQTHVWAAHGTSYLCSRNLNPTSQVPSRLPIAARVGDTWHHYRRPVEPLPGFKPAQSMVFAGGYWVCLQSTAKSSTCRRTLGNLWLTCNFGCCKLSRAVAVSPMPQRDVNPPGSPCCRHLPFVGRRL